MEQLTLNESCCFLQKKLVKGFAAIKYSHIHAYIILTDTKLWSDRLLAAFEKEKKNVSGNKVLNVSRWKTVSMLLCKMRNFTL